MDIEVRGKTYKIDTQPIGDAGMLVATCDDLKGLYVHGRSAKELAERIPQVIEAILDADASKPL